MNVVSESGIYKLVFTSRKPEAEKFTDWLATDVIPSIRKHGMYVMDELIENPDLAIRALTALKEEREKTKLLQSKVEEAKPKVDSFDKFISGENLQDMSTAAKVLSWGRNKLFARLRTDKIFRADNTPYQSYIDRGYFKVKETPVLISGEVLNKPQTYVTAKGVDWLSKILNV
jgi:anti-repressor protein